MKPRAINKHIKHDCPKCGSSRIKASAHQYAKDAVETTVSCLRCGFVGGAADDAYADYQTAIWQWNKTAKDTRP